MMELMVNSKVIGNWCPFPIFQGLKLRLICNELYHFSSACHNWFNVRAFRFASIID